MNKLIESKYKDCLESRITSVDIIEHLPTLKRYSSECNHVTEMGVRWVVSTWALLAGEPKKMISYDINSSGDIISQIERLEETSYKFIQADVLEVEIEETDLLFIDTLHTYTQLKKELYLHSPKVNKYIILHDTESFGNSGEGGGNGLNDAVTEFLFENRDWRIKEVFKNNNGLTVLEKR